MLNRIGKMKAKHQLVFMILIGFAVISFWRGIWGLMDVYLFPANYPLSLWVSVLLGIAILVITHQAAKLV